jgi:outer membrane protein assembly factor BamB
MRLADRKMGILVACLVLMIAGPALAQDWPQWRGPNRDGKVTGFTAPKTWPQQLTQKWKVTVGRGDATPALVGDRLYVFARQGGDEIMLCLSAATGKEIWQEKYAAQEVIGAPARHPGPRSSPVVAEGKVCSLGVGGVLSCLDAGSGKLIWRKDAFPGRWPQFFTALSPMIVDGMCIAHLGGQGRGAILAYDLATGEEKWRWAGDAPAYSSPVLLTIDGKKLIVTMTEKNMVAVDAADGKLVWKAPFVAQRMAYNAATPIIEGQTVIYTGQRRGAKAVKIEKQGDAFVAQDVWSNGELAPQFSTPVLKDGFLYGLSDRGNFYCINAKTGETAWTDSARHGNFGAILDAGSVLLALPSNAELIVFQPSGKAFTELAHIKVADKATYAHPVVAGNRVYVRDEDSVTLWIIE